jgi:hypothetical protein
VFAGAIIVARASAVAYRVHCIDFSIWPPSLGGHFLGAEMSCYAQSAVATCCSSAYSISVRSAADLQGIFGCARRHSSRAT